MTTTAKHSKIARSACETSTVNNASENSSSTLGSTPEKKDLSRLRTISDPASKNYSSAMSNSRTILSTRETSSTTTSTPSGPSESLALTTETPTTAHPTAVSQSTTSAAEATIDPSKSKKIDKTLNFFERIREKYKKFKINLRFLKRKKNSLLNP